MSEYPGSWPCAVIEDGTQNGGRKGVVQNGGWKLSGSGEWNSRWNWTNCWSQKKTLVVRKRYCSTRNRKSWRNLPLMLYRDTKNMYLTSQPYPMDSRKLENHNEVTCLTIENPKISGFFKINFEASRKIGTHWLRAWKWEWKPKGTRSLAQKMGSWFLRSRWLQISQNS